MNVKTAITLMLGLVFQLAQVLPGAAVTTSCASQEAACTCCEGQGSCPCMDNGKSENKPAPLVPNSGSILKLPLARAGDTRVGIESLGDTHPVSAVVASPVAGPSSGYAGVRLSVAFCSFVI